MIVKAFYAKCDNCGGEDLFGASKTHSQARSAAQERGWQKVNNFDFCARCCASPPRRREPLRATDAPPPTSAPGDGERSAYAKD